MQPVFSFGQDVTPVASFSVQQSNPSGSAWNLNNSSSISHGTIDTFLWDYGDGTTGTTPFYTKTYNQTTSVQTFTVKLTVTSNANCPNTASTTITVPAK